MADKFFLPEKILKILQGDHVCRLVDAVHLDTPGLHGRVPGGISGSSAEIFSIA